MADTEQFIDILIVVDAETVMDTYQGNLSTDPSSPRSLGTVTNLLYMFVKYDEVRSGQATSDLTVAVNPNNVVRWRAVSLTMNTAYSVVLSSCSISAGQSLITQPVPIVRSVYVPVPTVTGNIVTGTTKATLDDFFFQADAVGDGTVTYTFTFAVTSNEGKVLGYFKWDPTLSIS